jgi:hypothetical protein
MGEKDRKRLDGGENGIKGMQIKQDLILLT